MPERALPGERARADQTHRARAPAEVSSRAVKRDRTCRSAIKGTQARSHLPKCHQGHSSEIAPAEVSSRALKRRSHLPEPDHVDGAVAVLTHLAARAAAEQIEHQAAIDLKEAHAHLTQSDAIRCNQRRNQTQSSRDRPQRSSRPPDAIRCNQMQSDALRDAISKEMAAATPTRPHQTLRRPLIRAHQGQSEPLSPTRTANPASPAACITSSAASA